MLAKEVSIKKYCAALLVKLFVGVMLVASIQMKAVTVQFDDMKVFKFPLRALHAAGHWGTNETVVEGWESRGGAGPLVPPDYIEWLKSLHVNWIGLSVGLHYDDSMDSTVEPDHSALEGPTWSDEVLRKMIQEFRTNEINVYLTLALVDYEAEQASRPAVRWQLGDPRHPDNTLPENWPWRPDHPDHQRFVAEFWETYTQQAVHYARIAQEEGALLYSLGTETEALFRTRSGDPNDPEQRHWINNFGRELRSMVERVRAVYTGLLTYDMHYSVFEDPDHFGPGSDHLWEDMDLDIVGISAYFPLVDTVPETAISVETAQMKYEEIFDNHLRPLAERNPNRPSVFLEYGAPDVISAPAAPASDFSKYVFTDLNGNGLDDGQETQANMYQGLINAMANNPGVLNGVFYWDNWITSDGLWKEWWAGRRSFAIRGKLAEDVVRSAYGSYKEAASSPTGPTNLAATTATASQINLTWRDNSANETGFIVQRRVDGSSDWVGTGTTAANATTYPDRGLEPITTYHYRVRAFNDIGSSAFSNEVTATTLAALPPTLTRFTPKLGPAGTQVTLVGTHFLGATAVEFNGVGGARFEVVSWTGIEAVVPSGATSGPISVVTPGGTAVSSESFTVTEGFHSRIFVPIVLRSRGRTPGSFFTSELTLANRGTTTAAINYTFTAADGKGSGTGVDSLEPGRQRIVPDAIAYLTDLGIPAGSGSAAGTLAVDFSNLSSPSGAAVTVRVSTPVEDGLGRAGLAYPGLNPDGLLTGPAYITGLRQNRQDRSNVAVQNAGSGGGESITLRVTVYSGDTAAPGRSEVLPDLVLPPGGFHQYNLILNRAGFDNGYVKVERTEGTAPYYAYGVINDNFNSDGSFVFPLTESSLVGSGGQTLPVIIETGFFQSELTVTNFSASEKDVDFNFVADAVATGDDTASFSLKLKPGEQRILPGIVEELRRQEVDGIGRANRAFVGALFATVAEGDVSGIVIGARTGSPDKRGGQYSLFYNAVPYGSASVESAWIYGLQQNEENRSNLALVNTGEIDGSFSTLEITVYDGSGQSQPRTRSVTLGPRRWTQENGILGKISQGYVQVRKTSGNNPFIAYGVINDGGRPGERSGDGAYLPAQK